MGSLSFILFAATALVCVSFATAQRCPPNEILGACGRACELRCNKAPLPPSCRNCVGPLACRCPPGRARNTEGICVLIRNCPENNCAMGEIRGRCGRQCEGTCMRPNPPASCREERCDHMGCRCDLEGQFVRDPRGRCSRIGTC